MWTAPAKGTIEDNDSSQLQLKPYIKNPQNGVKVALVKVSEEDGKTKLTSLISSENNKFQAHYSNNAKESNGTSVDLDYDGFWISSSGITIDSTNKYCILDFKSCLQNLSLNKDESIMLLTHALNQDTSGKVAGVAFANRALATITFKNSGSNSVTTYQLQADNLSSTYGLNQKYIDCLTKATEVDERNYEDRNWSYKFVKLLDSYTVTEKVEDKEDATYIVYEDDEFTLPAAPTVDGKVFIGWDIGNDALKSAGDKISVTSDATITAVCVDFSTDKGAYFRLVTDSTGIRFDAKIKTSDKTALAKYGTLTFGMKISSQTEGLTEGGLDLTVAEDKITASGDYSVLRCALVGFFEESENAESKFHGIDLYNAEFKATAYVKIASSNGDSIIVETNDSDAKSVAKMSYDAFNDYKDVKDEDYAYSVEGYENKYWQFNYSKDELDIIKGFADKYTTDSNSEENA